MLVKQCAEVRWSGGAGALASVPRPCGRSGRLRGRSGPIFAACRRASSSATVEASENGVSVRVASVSDGAALPRSSKTGVAASEKPCEAAHRQAELAQEGGELAQRGLPVRRPVRRSPAAAAPALAEEAGDVAALARERREDLVGVARPAGQLVALGGEDAEEAVDVAQDRVGALDDFSSVFAAAGEAGAEFVEDQREALRVGQGLDVVDQVGVDAGAVARAAAGTGRRPSPLAILLQRRRRRRAGARGRVGGSRRTSRRSATAGGSGRWRRCGSPGSRGRRSLSDDRRLACPA